ncbi:cell division protein PerM [Cellulomonas alba]|uniref:DUF6350 family protein n=1 Tax=Cellulomonas alba TaxID=3053467 RepID=A0ABT7SDI1_9CELL|nr:DUF6350 family protein [Cellulomonas alba]MDM7854232.1 DUF6350 family protein [Cellulomonas alba]
MTAADTRTRPASRDGAREPRARGRRPVSTSPFFTSALDGAPHWAVGALTALQAALLSLLVLVLPAIAAFVATSADPSNADVGWVRAVRVGAALWLAGHGVPLHVSGVTIGLVPLGVTGLAVFACYASARRSGSPTASGFVAGVASYGLSVALVAGVVAPADLARAVAGAVVVAVLGLGGGLLRRPDAPSWRETSRPVWSRLTPAVRCGAAAGLLAAALLLLAAAALTLLWIVAGRATIGDVVRGIGVDGIGGFVFAAAELAYLPNLVVWALAWLAGPGFHVGAGTHFAPGEVAVGPMPAVPMLGALPTADFAGGAARAVPVVLVLVGALAGWYVHRRLRSTRWTTVVAAVATAGLTTAVLVLVLVAAASGSAGPGRLAEVGAQAWLVGLYTGAGVLLGAALVAVPTDGAVRSGVLRAVRGVDGEEPRVRVRARGVVAEAPVVAVPVGAEADDATPARGAVDPQPDDGDQGLEPRDADPAPTDEGQAAAEPTGAPDVPGAARPGKPLPGEPGQSRTASRPPASPFAVRTRR